MCKQNEHHFSTLTFDNCLSFKSNSEHLASIAYSALDGADGDSYHVAYLLIVVAFCIQQYAPYSYRPMRTRSDNRQYDVYGCAALGLTLGAFITVFIKAKEWHALTAVVLGDVNVCHDCFCPWLELSRFAEPIAILQQSVYCLPGKV
jgi:hypothetical protein